MRMTQMSPQMTTARQDGFSLLEVLVGLAILGLVATLVLGSIVPRGDRARAIALKAAVEARFVDASVLAQQSGWAVSLRFNLPAARLEAAGIRPLAIPRDAVLRLISAKELKDEGLPAVLFFPDGSNSGITYNIVIGSASEGGTLSWLGGLAAGADGRL
jgi:prepilin-type N-terminal cleavage/methylation domain-containing protein